MPEETKTTAELRRHYFLDKYVVIAPKRTHSLHHKRFVKHGVLGSPPLDKEPSLFEIPAEGGGWAVKVVKNAFPAFSEHNKLAYGHQEIVLCTPTAATHFSSLPAAQIQRILAAYQQRLHALYGRRKVKYVSIFHNAGLEAGASIRQIHSQIVAVGITPPELTQWNDRVKIYKKHHSEHPLAHALSWETSQQARIITRGRYFTAFCPYASEFPFEVWLVPHEPVNSLRQLGSGQIGELSSQLKGVTTALDKTGISYNYHLHEPVAGHSNYFYLRINPRPNVQAGFELNTGIIINPVAPETAAEWYRSYVS